MSNGVLWGVLMPENEHGRRPQIPAKDRAHAERMAPKLGGEVAEYTGLPEVHAAWLRGMVRLFGEAS